jgi:hypothetical protein
LLSFCRYAESAFLIFATCKMSTLYCRGLRQPILVAIEREGVVYARVYDMRGGQPQKPLTQPPS